MNKQRGFLWNGFGLTSNGILQLDAAGGIPGPLKSPGKFLRMSFLTVSARRIGLGAKTSS
jgi:hypothetical protein